MKIINIFEATKAKLLHEETKNIDFEVSLFGLIGSSNPCFSGWTFFHFKWIIVVSQKVYLIIGNEYLFKMGNKSLITE